MSLREAVNLANAYGSAGDSAAITFGPSFSSGPQTITLTAGALQVTGDVTITGPAAGLTVSGNNQSRVFVVGDGTNPSSLTLDDLTIADGTIDSDVGGGVLNRANSSLTLLGCLILDCSATSANGSGGGVANQGTLTVIDCTFYGDSAYYDGGGLLATATATVIFCTFTNDSATNPFNSAAGGAMRTYSGGTTSAFNVLMFNNVGHDIGSNSGFSTSDSTVTDTTGDYNLTGDNTAPAVTASW